MAKNPNAPMNRKMQAYGAKTSMPPTSTAPPAKGSGPMTATGGMDGKMAGIGSKPTKAFRDGKY